MAMFRRLFTILAALSLVLCAAMIWLDARGGRGIGGRQEIYSVYRRSWHARYTLRSDPNRIGVYGPPVLRRSASEAHNAASLAAQMHNGQVRWSHPGQMLKEEFLIPLELTQRELAERLQVSYPRLNDLIHGRRGMTPDTALRLERLLGVEAQFWLNLQLAWDLHQARRSDKAKAIRRIHRLPAVRRAS